MATILDGKALAEQMNEQSAGRVAALVERGCTPTLAYVQVGKSAESAAYVQSQRRRCEQVGIRHRLIELDRRADTEAVVAALHRLNADRAVHGLIVGMPLPEHIEAVAVQMAISLDKDVEGLHPANAGLLAWGLTDKAPNTARAVMEILRHYKVPLRGTEAVVIGQSQIVGKPITLLLIRERATVTAIRSAVRDLPEHTRRAELLIAAMGRAKMITADMVRPGAVVIDVGINRVEEQTADGGSRSVTVGDVDFEPVSKVAGMTTPVPGGVGPVTVAVLLRQLIEAAEKASTG
jgi:methylenetetrahydrofolate dehydrogenase (NADP+)/methenyltetrahydrofolate cyclohydrolase